MNIIKNYCTKNDCYKKYDKIDVKGLVLHSTGCAQPSAEVWQKLYNKANFECCMHGFIDGNTGDMIQTLPFEINGWQVGGSANKTHLGFEMCESNYIKYNANGTAFTVTDLAKAQKSAKTTYDSAVILFAQLCKEFSLDPMKKGVIISHYEAGKSGVGSCHIDPEHYWKGLKLSYTMDGFRKDVKAALDKANAPQENKDTKKKVYKIQVGAFTSKKNAEAYKKQIEKDGYNAVIVEVEI